MEKNRKHRGVASSLQHSSTVDLWRGLFSSRTGSLLFADLRISPHFADMLLPVLLLVLIFEHEVSRIERAHLSTERSQMESEQRPIQDQRVGGILELHADMESE